MVSRREFERANARAAALRAEIPTALGCRYDRRLDRVIISLSTGIEVAFSPRNAQGLETAKPADLSVIEISPSGYGLHFPKLDADIYVPALLEGYLGSKRWMAARVDRRGAEKRGTAKARALRSNGTLGGRPRKIKIA
jgi:hypothetical protein